MTMLRRLRLVPVAVLTWVSASAATQFPQSAGIIALCGGGSALLITAVFALLARGNVRTVRLCALTAVLALSAAAVAAMTVALELSAREAGTPSGGGRGVSVVAIVTGKVERWGSDRVSFDARVSWLTQGSQQRDVDVPASVIVPRHEVPADLDVGATVTVAGSARSTEPGERAVMEVTATEIEVTAAPQGMLAIASALRRGLVAASHGLPQPGGGLVPGLAVGDTSGLDPALDDDMKAASLSHLTAVSGANCALVVGMAFALAALCGLRRGIRVAAGTAALVSFVILVTPEPSVVRAAVMAAVAMLGVALGRTGAGVAVLCTAITLILIGDPWLAGSLGFALSAAATAALLLFARPLASGLSRWMPRSLALALAVPLSAQLACGPLLVLITPSTPLYGVLANLLAAPAAGPATIVGLAACVAAPIPLLQSGLAGLAWIPAAWIAETARLFASLPGNTVPWVGGGVGVLVLAALGIAIGVVVVGVGARAGGFRRLLWGASVILISVVVGVSAGRAALSTVAGPLTMPADWSVIACDVGQGDALLLRSAGRVALIDTGPTPEPVGTCLRRAGVERVDMLVLTHFDLDHAGGVSAVIGRVGTVLHGPPADARDTALLARLSRAGARVVAASAGLSGALGTASWRVLWPRADSTAFPPGNESGVVVDVRGGGIPPSIWLADLSGAAQRALAASGALAPPYDIVKVAHHGSADQDPELYGRLGAALGLISVGQGNPYRHPRASTLAFLASDGVRVDRTDEEGMIAVVAGAHGLTVWRERVGDPQ